MLAVACAGLLAGPVRAAEEEAQQRVLPTLLIKGEIVSVDTADPSANLLKVKDRYGFETPIYLTPETKIAQGEQALAAADLKTGTAVEVEYNFDINTAKRHAVNVSLSVPATQAAAPMAPAMGSAQAPGAMPAMPAAPAMAPEQVMTPAAAPAVPAAPAGPAAAPEASTTPKQPAATTTQ